MENKVTIKIPKPLYEKLKVSIEGSGFSSVTEFVVYVLRDLVSHQEISKESSNLSAKEIEAIRKRLKSMGYF
ncbi:MAG: CopG family transcriptional regulator [Acidobacteriota bacterium]|nr:CopG family transcriptional regulator [Thermoanaerobaculaceae bacterium]